MNWRIWRLALGCVLLASLALAQTAAKAVAVVNGVTITAAELDAVLKAGGPTAVTMTEAVRKQRKLEALGMLIENVLMRQFLEKETKPIAAEEVARRLDEMKAGLKEQGKSVEEFCQDTNQTLAQLKANIAEHFRWTAYVQARLSDEAVAEYFKENRDFFDGTTVRASHIVVRLPATATDGEKAKAKQTLAQLRDKLKADPKADFGELAKAHSQDPQASKGGDLGWIPRKWYDEAFSKAAFALPVGEVSDVVQTDYGVHLIKVTEKKPGKAFDFVKNKEAVREFCSEDMRQQILTRLRKEARVTITLPE